METAKVPTHVAIIMDGNGRWAIARKLPRLAGHRATLGESVARPASQRKRSPPADRPSRRSARVYPTAG